MSASQMICIFLLKYKLKYIIYCLFVGATTYMGATNNIGGRGLYQLGKLSSNHENSNINQFNFWFTTRYLCRYIPIRDIHTTSISASSYLRF